VSALREVAARAPDLMLLDFQMPGLSGVDALPSILAAAPQMAVILVTGSGDVGAATRALVHGAFDVVAKPVDFTYLAQSIDTALALRDLREKP